MKMLMLTLPFMVRDLITPEVLLCMYWHALVCTVLTLVCTWYVLVCTKATALQWLEYINRTMHPVLRWLPTKLAEWIGENLQDVFS
jgi:hypothetical protein